MFRPPLAARSGKCRQRFAAQFRSQRRRHEPLRAPHFGFADREDRVARLHRLRTQCGGIGVGILRRVEPHGPHGRGRNALAIRISEFQPFGRRLRRGLRRNHPPRAAALHGQRETAVEIAADLRPGRDPLHAIGRDAATLHGVDVGPGHAARRQETDAVARRKIVRTVERERAARNARHAAHPFADRLRGVERRHSGALSVQKIVGLPACKTLRRIGREIRDALADGRPHQPRPQGQRLVHRPAVVGHNVPDISEILEPTFYLE